MALVLLPFVSSPVSAAVDYRCLAVASMAPLFPHLLSSKHPELEPIVCLPSRMDTVPPLPLISLVSLSSLDTAMGQAFLNQVIRSRCREKSWKRLGRTVQQSQNAKRRRGLFPMGRHALTGLPVLLPRRATSSLALVDCASSAEMPLHGDIQRSVELGYAHLR
ncbi:hypothetical protein LZ32DRAFT_121432 [Colletotrichum eremochloae]|nr:hypothetical protein LZ32DRAFT_121432 [Colletotrichum eremochloae]